MNTNSETFEQRMARESVERIEARALEAERERDQALKELLETRAAVDWTMKQLKIADVIMQSDERLPAGATMPADGEDTARLDYLNQHCRVGLGGASNVFIIALPLDWASTDDQIPVPFNIRHIIDLCRKEKSLNHE